MNATASADDHAPLTVRALLDAYARGDTDPQLIAVATLARIEASDRPEAWTLVVPAADLQTTAASLARELAEAGPAIFERKPLFGVPFAVKDNIDIAGLPTTAACPAFAYTPGETAFAVQRLIDAGAMLIGKTNLDQFATGLVGTRSPHGAVRQVSHPEYVSGGSSSGSAVTVAQGIVAFSLGTDTAGSGRVPAGFNGIVGLKPSLGLVSKRGVVPACKSLDTLSIFAHDVADAWIVLQQMVTFDALDGYSRRVAARGLLPDAPRVAIPDTLEFFGDTHAADAFAATLDRLQLEPATFPFAPMQRAAALLYDGPWVAERRAALGDFFVTNRDDIDPTVAKVIGKADAFSAADAFNAQYELTLLKREAEALFERFDILIVPTTPTHPTIAQVQANPVEVNSRLGVYTNFVNLLDLCALAVPGPPRADGLPAGITLIGPAGADRRLAALGAKIQALSDASIDPLPIQEPSIELAVVGAHLRGMPLEWQMKQAGARFIEEAMTSPHYTLYALADTQPPKPGLVRTENEGAAIAIEIWEMPMRTFGAFVAAIPAPLGIGTVTTADGRIVKGFICEPAAVAPDSGARDITSFGGWRAYRHSLVSSSSDQLKQEATS
ncbi:allophanate hydrolase [Caballeronia zhejiangensis]|uniref:Allophanate hydrolase n=1 Tax=Caballeronia zhejiangensis TaxID=871203 RepID=A0A656QV37_9BURK|nr:allophanate hydrolase [Caballeronia zhejiangensis]KDR34017.1 allophanate hydrolase [Caballeronia zhejiangensis]